MSDDELEGKESSGSGGDESEMPQFVRPVKVSIVSRLRTYFFTGIIVVAPVSITLYLAWQFIHFVDTRVTPLVPARYNPETYLPFSIPGLGLLIVLVALTVTGALTANILGNALVRFGERLLDRVPVVRNVYGALKQIFETVLKQSSTSFRQVVLVEYPRRGIWAIAFITGETEGEVQELTDQRLINVFLPTTPNPTSGFLLFVPREDLIPLHMTIEQGIKMVISGGIVTPPSPAAAGVTSLPGAADKDSDEDDSPKPRRPAIPNVGT